MCPLCLSVLSLIAEAKEGAGSERAFEFARSRRRPFLPLSACLCPMYLSSLVGWVRGLGKHEAALSDFTLVPVVLKIRLLYISVLSLVAVTKVGIPSSAST